MESIFGKRKVEFYDKEKKGIIDDIAKTKKEDESDPIILKPALFHDIPANKTWIGDDTTNTSGIKNAGRDKTVTKDPGTNNTRATSTLSSSPLFSYFESFVKMMHQLILNFNVTSTFHTKKSHTNLDEQQAQTNVTPRLGITMVCISDTHGQHRKLTMPDHADVLIHAGDFTRFGKKEDAIDFNEWLGSLPYKTKLVVNGNHECNAMWKHSAKSLLSNARLLINESVEVELNVDSDSLSDENGNSNSNSKWNENDSRHVPQPKIQKGEEQEKKKEKKTLHIHGTNFYSPYSTKHNPYFEQIDSKTDIIIAHCPALGYVDRDRGCPALLHTIQRVQPMLVISGHEHMARGIVKEEFGNGDDFGGTTLINAANAKGGIRNGHAVGKEPIILML